MRKAVLTLCATACLIVLLAGAAGAQDPTRWIGLKAYGGLNFLGGGELNSGQEAWTGYYGAILGIFGYQGRGDFKPAALGLSFGGEAIYQFSASLGIGLGVGYLQASRTYEVEYEPGFAFLEPYVNSAETELSAVPLKLNVYYFLPAGRFLSFNVQAGLGYYLVRGLARQRLEEAASGFWIEEEYDVRGGGLGFQAGLAAEAKLGPRISLFLEAQGRIAAFANLEGDLRSSDETGWSDSVGGPMWSYDLDLGSLGVFSVFEVSNAEPSGSGISGVHRTRADFSGFSLVVGFIVRL